MAVLNGNEVLTSKKYTQVYQATHMGENTLPYMYRSFISFTFGGKKIEDFNLIATIANNSLDRRGYASFEDIVTSYDNLNGQQYWNTHYKVNEMNFILATDGINQRDLDAFLMWFRAGETKELILAEHPNRAILARVKDVPQLNLLPFEEKVSFKVNTETYLTSTTLYKGEIILNLVMDQPYWYSLTNILGKRNGDHYENVWDDITVNPPKEINIFASQDALKILYEDGIPLGTMIQDNMLLGNKAFAQVEDNIASKIWDPNYRDDGGNSIANIDNVEGGGACINGDGYIGMTAGAIIDANSKGIQTLYKGSDAFFYYSGTAPSPTIISFTFTPQVDNVTGYITVPANTYALEEESNKPYNTFIVASVNQQELCFTTPNLYTSYNKVNNIFSTYVNENASVTWEGIREMIRTEVRHPYVRAWANHAIDVVSNGAKLPEDEDLSSIKNEMIKFLQNTNNSIEPATFIFNSETGEAKGIFKYHTDENKLSTMEENVGDMLRSNYITIRDRNYPNEDGAIVGWTVAHKEYSHKISHNVAVPLSDISILYKNMYL